jgi:hypothetical protein
MTSLLIAAFQQGVQLFTTSRSGTAAVIGIRRPQATDTADFTGRHAVDPESVCEVLLEEDGARIWTRVRTQAVTARRALAAQV